MIINKIIFNLKLINKFIIIYKIFHKNIKIDLTIFTIRLNKEIKNLKKNKYESNQNKVFFKYKNKIYLRI